MQTAGSESWRFAEGIEQLPNTALFVRDAVGLVVPAGPTIPPRLAGPLPDRSQVLAPEVRSEAGRQWATWWQAILTHEARMQRGDHGADRPAWLRGLADDLHLIVDTTDFAALSDRPVLRDAVRATFVEGCRWTDDQRSAWLPPARGPLFGWEMTRDVAEEVAARRGVGLDAVRACAVVLMVEGTWWRHFAPGVVLCSLSATQDPKIARTALQEAFESGLSL
jgi:hypothetical protein